MGLKGKPNFVRKISEMKIGEEGYVYANALNFDKEGNAYLNKNFILKNSEKETDEDDWYECNELIKIKKFDEDKYNIDISDCEYEWRKVRKVFPYIRKNRKESIIKIGKTLEDTVKKELEKKDIDFLEKDINEIYNEINGSYLIKEKEEYKKEKKAKKEKYKKDINEIKSSKEYKNLANQYPKSKEKILHYLYSIKKEKYENAEKLLKRIKQKKE